MVATLRGWLTSKSLTVASAEHVTKSVALRGAQRALQHEPTCSAKVRTDCAASGFHSLTVESQLAERNEFLATRFQHTLAASCWCSWKLRIGKLPREREARALVARVRACDTEARRIGPVSSVLEQGG